jgi:hypothetical protein
MATAARGYTEALPIVAVSRCPHTGAVFETSIDPFDVDGLWWSYEHDHRTRVPRPATFFAWTGALQLGGPIPRWSLKSMVGPGAPFVVRPFIEHPSIKAVLSSIRIGAHTGIMTTYFAERAPDIQSVGDWAQRGTFIDDELADFDLGRWLDRQKMYWCAPDDAHLELRSGQAGCPYIGHGGERRRRFIQEGETWLA